jgi:cytoskeletal protein CcmA (bactofilin family)
VVFGTNVTIESGETFEGDLVLFGGNVTVEEDAALDGDLVVIGGSVDSNGELNGDVVIVGGQVHLDEEAIVTGSVILVGGQLQKAEGATIEGEIINNASPQIDLPHGSIPPIAPIVPDIPVTPEIPNLPGIFNVGFNPFFEFSRVLSVSIVMAFVGMLIVLFFPQRLTRVSQAVATQPLMTTGIGLLTVIALIISAITIILLPIVILSLLPLFFAWLFGISAIGQEIGERFAGAIRKDWAPVLTTGLGTFGLMFIVGSIQALDDFLWLLACFAWIVPLFVGIMGIGAVVMTQFGAKQVQGPGTSVVPPPAGQGEVPPAS